MTQINQHTPLPWKTVPCEEAGYEKHVNIATEDEEDYPVENDCDKFSRVAMAQCDAEFIVHACNSHYKLQEENKRLKTDLYHLRNVTETSLLLFQDAKGVWADRAVGRFNKALDEIDKALEGIKV